MIRAMIFDLDGTLVQTEKLKALSYAKAVVELCPQEIQEGEVIQAFKEVVGLSRKEVALRLIERFHLDENVRRRMDEFGVDTLWQAFVQVRLNYYEELLGDPGVLRSNQWPHNMALLQEARRAKCKLGLATMSDCTQVNFVLKALNLENAFDFVASRDDVEHGKPEPEIYNLVASELSVPAQECLVIEDSPSGVKAALAAGMWVIAVTTPFTRDAFRKDHLLDERWVVDDPDTLPQVLNNLKGWSHPAESGRPLNI
ncbi:MAG TPA: HAD family phosphatase [Anaerolineales bacterium]|nr:HAD family phosphatase [Anaerolineales bacterium]